MIFRPKSEIQRFFPPKIRWSPTKKKRSSPNVKVIFRSKSEIQRFFPPKFRWSPKKKKKKKGLHRYRDWFFVQFRKFSLLRGGCFPFFSENQPQKHKKHAILHTSQANGGSSSPPTPPPGYATGRIANMATIWINFQQKFAWVKSFQQFAITFLNQKDFSHASRVLQDPL